MMSWAGDVNWSRSGPVMACPADGCESSVRPGQPHSQDRAQALAESDGGDTAGQLEVRSAEITPTESQGGH